MNLATPSPMRRYSQYSLVKLPVELLLQIRSQMGFGDIQNLRLVCKHLNDIFAPTVLSHIHLGDRSYVIRGREYMLFPCWGGYMKDPNITVTRPSASLRDLTSGHESLAFVKSLTVSSLEWLVYQPYLLKQTNLFQWLQFVKNGRFRRDGLVRIHWQGKLPNLESVKWDIEIDGPNTSFLFLKVFILLPSLKELHLSLKPCDNEYLDSFMDRLARVSGLQTLTLHLRRSYTDSYDNYLWGLGRLVANNPDLMNLRLVCDGKATLSPLRLFHHVPADRPAKFKKLLLDIDATTSELDMIPHLRSLQSLDIRRVPPNFWEALALNGIFIPFLTVGEVNGALCEYLLLNTNLVSLTMLLGYQNLSHIGSHGLLRALKNTNVVQITTSQHHWAKWSEDAEIEVCLGQCGKLQKITVIFEKAHSPVYNDIDAMARTVSRLGDKISLEISGEDRIHRVFRKVFRKCRQSEDYPMKSLQQRLVFLDLQDQESSSSFPWS